MRKAILTLLGATATTTLLIGGKFVLAPTSSQHALKEPPPSQVPSSGALTPTQNPILGQWPNPWPSVWPTPSWPHWTMPTFPFPTLTVPPPNPGPTASPSSPEPSPSSPEPSPSVSCDAYDGDVVDIGPPSKEGKVNLNITVCGGVLTEVAGGVMFSDYEPQNSDAIEVMNVLALKYYQTDFARINVSGATETSVAYRASLRSALNRAGL